MSSSSPMCDQDCVYANFSWFICVILIYCFLICLGWPWNVRNLRTVGKCSGEQSMSRTSANCIRIMYRAFLCCMFHQIGEFWGKAWPHLWLKVHRGDKRTKKKKTNTKYWNTWKCKTTVLQQGFQWFALRYFTDVKLLVRSSALSSFPGRIHGDEWDAEDG